jgi:hypothetical protein
VPEADGLNIERFAPWVYGLPARPGKATLQLSFTPFRLDLASERLWKNGEELRLRRKPFAILRHLVQADGTICVTLPHIAAEAGARDDAPECYVRIRVTDGVAQGPLVAHLYDLGPRRGYRLAGLERPQP